VDRGLDTIEVEGFGILADVKVSNLGRVNVLVGPNGSGKTTLLSVIQFLGDAARLQLAEAVRRHGGFDRLRTRPATDASPRKAVRIRIAAMVTAHANENALDEYELRLRPVKLHATGSLLSQHGDVRISGFVHDEEFKFKRQAGKGRRLTLKAGKLHIQDEGKGNRQLPLALDKDAFGLALLPQLGAEAGGSEIKKIQELFTTFRVFDIDVRAARQPADVRERSRLRHNAGNLAAFLAFLSQDHADQFAALVADAKQMVPGLEDVCVRSVGGAREAVTVDLVDHGRSGVTPLADASFGTVRTLALLAMLYDPSPPLLTCVEEIDHGLHPHLFDRLVDLVRQASARTQFLIATHSPALVNRLRPEELVVCERDATTGLARIPAITREEVQTICDAGDLGPGELWFSGTLGGIPR